MSLIQCCPACQSTNLEPLFQLGRQPKSLIALKTDPLESVASPLHHVNLSICRNCGHVHNIEFDTNSVAYSGDGCRMYNSGDGWKEHVDEVRKQCEQIPDIDTIIEIGAGDCAFLDSLKTDAAKLAVDPCKAVEKAEDLGIPYSRAYFDANRHIPTTSTTTLIIMRHLLEHMGNPREFLERLVVAAKKREHDTFLYVETPCCQEALKKTRIEDWTYEHPQHFTVNSLAKLFRACGIIWVHVAAGYGGEVLKGLAKIMPEPEKGISVTTVLNNYKGAEESINNAAAWARSYIPTIALWGGAGKSAVFINKFKMPDETVVVDSHDEKWGYCVPGTKIKMVSPDVLKTSPVDYIIATTSWRANDIAREIVARGINCKQLLKFENGNLTEVPLGN